MQYTIYDKHDTIIDTNLDKDTYKERDSSEAHSRLLSWFFYCFLFPFFSSLLSFTPVHQRLTYALHRTVYCQRMAS